MMMVLGMVIGALIMLFGVMLGAAISMGSRTPTSDQEIDIP